MLDFDLAQNKISPINEAMHHKLRFNNDNTNK